MNDKVDGMDRELYRTVMGTPEDEMEKERARPIPLRGGKPYTIQRSGKEGAKVSVPATFLVYNGLEIGDKVYEHMNEKGELVISPTPAKAGG